jgi:23S rRNA (cytosine1962-C5)-methyltransferase
MTPSMDLIVQVCRDKIRLDNSGSARRLFHGRGHSFPGFEHVVVNWYPPYLHIAMYAEVEGAVIDKLVEGLLAAIPGVHGVAVQFRESRRSLTKVWHGEVPDEHLIYENGLAFWIQPKRNQNVGLFLDMGQVRSALAPFTSGAKVLNLFAYTCAFSVSAVAQGAELVVNNDMNANVLGVGKRNHLANHQDMRKVRMLSHNLFKAWKKVRQYGPYDVIVIDPPTNQRGSFVAEKHYPQVLKHLPQLAAKNACVVACLNSPFLGPDFLQNQMARWSPNCELVENMPPHPDFPEAVAQRGLKVQRYRYR